MTGELGPQNCLQDAIYSCTDTFLASRTIIVHIPGVAYCACSRCSTSKGLLPVGQIGWYTLHLAHSIPVSGHTWTTEQMHYRLMTCLLVTNCVKVEVLRPFFCLLGLLDLLEVRLVQHRTL